MGLKHATILSSSIGAKLLFMLTRVSCGYVFLNSVRVDRAVLSLAEREKVA